MSFPIFRQDISMESIFMKTCRGISSMEKDIRLSLKPYFNLKKRTLMAFCFFLLKGFIVHMKDIKVLLKHLQTSINKEDWKAIQQDTKKLKNSSPVVYTGANKNDLPKEFVKLDVQFHLDALELVNACQEKNKDKAMAAFFKVVNGCDECHAK